MLKIRKEGNDYHKIKYSGSAKRDGHGCDQEKVVRWLLELEMFYFLFLDLGGNYVEVFNNLLSFIFIYIYTFLDMCFIFHTHTKG